jgi:hypothetical protein
VNLSTEAVSAVESGGWVDPDGEALGSELDMIAKRVQVRLLEQPTAVAGTGVHGTELLGKDLQGSTSAMMRET